MHAQRRRRPSRRSRYKSFWLVTEILFLLALAGVLGVVVAAFFSVSKLLPVGKGVGNFEPKEATKIYSSDGVLLADIYEENREFVPIDKIPLDLQHATVAIEDSRFYKHMGVDFVGVARAVYQNFRRGHMAQGGSTLTQQLARNIYLTREKKLSRKLQEMVLAYQLERNYSKEQILELYLNQVYYGSKAYGVQSASKVYFGKDVKDLTLAECAMLAGLPQKPSGYSPYKNMDDAISRRNIVLRRMCELHYITPRQRDEAIKEKAHLIGLNASGHAPFKAPWFVYYVLDELQDKYKCDEDMIYRGGLRVYTTLNYAMQQAAEEELRSHVREAKYKHVSQGALVCIDPKNGYIKSMVGGVTENYSKDQYNRAVQARRQPGSSFKAFVYTAAIDSGYDPNYRISNSRVTYGNWSPQNFDGRYGGMLTIKQAVAHSVNICAVRMAEKVGIDKVITYARMLGIKSPLTPNLTLALGSCGVSPLEMCSAYGVFAADGIRAEPLAVVRVATSSRDSNEEEVLFENKPDTRRVLSEETAGAMNEIFRGVVVSRGGTGYAAAKVPNAHGKTGTTSDDRDAWFLGYTPDLVAAVWVGNDKYGEPMRNVWGGNVCAPTWANFMLRSIKIRQQEKLAEQKHDEKVLSEASRSEEKQTGKHTSDSAQEEFVSMCAESGLRATSQCPTTYKERIRPGQKVGICTLHGGGDPATVDQPKDTQPVDNEVPNSDRTSTPEKVPHTAKPANPTSSTQTRREGDYVELTICVDSGQIANEYCPQTVPKRFLASEAPRRICRLHRAPRE